MTDEINIVMGDFFTGEKRGCGIWGKIQIWNHRR